MATKQSKRMRPAAMRKAEQLNAQCEQEREMRGLTREIGGLEKLLQDAKERKWHREWEHKGGADGGTVGRLIEMLQKCRPDARVTIFSEKYVSDPAAIQVAANEVGGLDIGYEDTDVWLYTLGAARYMLHSQPVR